ncbi:unnamed protein product [Pseudo-nitzschia multistriata]|uniref:Peroxisomal membrane protein 4 n=1 Tax=Pseudo-nitzschia multistriata TaxID=183589 RepID=A0A448ZSH3_9STRA|nr:unnamed protein product [Pseudo-nitzschia multistriata]
MQPTQKSFLQDELAAVISAVIGGASYGIKIRLPHALVMTCLFRNDLTPREKIRTILKLVFEHASNLAAFATIYKVFLAVLKGSSRCLRQGVGLNDYPNNQPRTTSNAIKSLGRTLIALIVDGPFFSTDTSSVWGSSSSTRRAGEPERPYHSLLAGAAGGYIVWGRYSSVNHQIVLYLASRIMVGLAKRGWELVYKEPGHFRNDNRGKSILQHPQTYPMVAATVWGIVMLLFEESPHVLHRSLKKSMDEIYRRGVF